MNKENLLGAPTEGLGQTVTFAGTVRGGGSQLGADGFSPLRSGVQGAQGPSAVMGQGPQAVNDPTMALLAKAGQDILAPNIEKARTEAFLNGMQQVAGGRALADIAKEQPWYMKVFGDSDLIAGARAYTQQTKAQETISALQDNMEELRKLPGNQFNEHVRKLIDSNMTGDAAADAGLMQAMSRTLPGLYSAHAREHVKHLQFETATAQSAMRGSAAKLLQQQYAEFASNEVRPGADQISADSQFLGTLGQPDGQDDKSYAQNLGRSFQEWAESGNFHAIRVAKAAGYFDKVDPALRPKIEDLIDRNAAQAINAKQAEPIARKWLGIRAAAQEGGTTGDRILEDIDKLNAEARDLLGISGDVIPRAQLEGVYLTAENANRRLDEAFRREAEAKRQRAASSGNAAEATRLRAEAEAGDTFNAINYLKAGQYATISNGMGAPAVRKLDNLLTGLVAPAWLVPDKAHPQALKEAVTMIAKNARGGAPLSSLKDTLNTKIGIALSPIASEQSLNEFRNVMLQFKALYAEDPYAARKMFGDEYERLNYAARQVSADGQIPGGFTLLRDRIANPDFRPPAPDKVDKAEDKEIAAGVKKLYTSTFFKGADDVSNPADKQLLDRIRPYVQSAAGKDVAERTTVGLAAWHDQGNRIIAGLPVQMPKHLRTAQAFTDALAKGNEGDIASDSWEKYSQDAITSLLRKKAGNLTLSIAGITMMDTGAMHIVTDRTGIEYTLPLNEIGAEIVKVRQARQLDRRMGATRAPGGKSF